MLKGYVTSDSDDLDDLDAMYCEPPVKIKHQPRPSLKIQNDKLREKLDSAMKEAEKISLFLKAADEGDLNTIEELISLGVSVDCSKPKEWTPLLKACGTGNFEVVQFLLENGSNPNLHKELLTPLMVCCHYSLTPESSKLNCVRLLLQHGADVNANDKYKTTALMYACENGYEDIVNELLAVPGININLQDKEGLSALFYAVNSNKPKIVEKLMLAGIDLRLKDRFNRTAMNLALENGLLDLAKVLGFVERKETDFKEKETEATYRFLMELPDADGKGGFESDVRLFMASLGFKDVKNISFPEFLNITDKKLFDIGVKLKPHREKILSLVHCFHLKPWTKFSIHEIDSGMLIFTEDAVAILGDVAKHLTLANASLQYLSTRLTLKSSKSYDSATIKDLLYTLVDIHQAAEKISIILPKILTHIKQMKHEPLDDYIFPYKEEKKITFIKCLWFVFGLTAVGFVAHSFFPQKASH